MFHFLSKFFRDIVALGFAAFVGEKLCRGDEIVPLALGKSALDVASGDVVLQQSVDESRIKVVACADGAHGVGLLYRIALGKPIVGSHFYGVLSLRIDKLAAKDESKKVCEKTYKKESNVSSTADISCTGGTQSYTCPDSTVTYNNMWLNKNLLKVDSNEFIIVNEVDGRPLANSQTEIIFAHATENGWIPGITNKQLLAILCERFKKDPKKVEILRALMNS